jgi:putative oxygen-independent coproporphyrinogen III oxidase
MSFAVYVHWPFCKSKCPYCDFNSHVRDTIDGDAWKNAMLREIDHFAALTPGKQVTSVFFGGGTPSLMEPSLVAGILERIATRWAIADEPEITLEANPNSSEAAHFAAFKAAGVNRLSIGVQALDDAALKFLGRGHDVREARRAIDRAAAVFDRFSFDLIYARPGQTVAAWADELALALALAPTHLSLYQLTIEEGTQFKTLFARGDYKLPDEDVQEQLYDQTNATLSDAGLAPYEVSNYAKRGQESRHNLVYWRYEDYVGVGPGAHGRIVLDGKRHATRQAKAPETWLSEVAAHGHATVESVPLDQSTQIDEAVMMGLRLTEGIDAARFERVTGAALEGPGALDPSRVTRMIADGFMKRTPTGLAATPQGMKLLNALLGALRG